LYSDSDEPDETSSPPEKGTYIKDRIKK
jgi:hypothetical protein